MIAVPQNSHPDLFESSARSKFGRASQKLHDDQIMGANEFELTRKNISEIFNRKVYSQIIKSRAFRRLKGVHFLGAIDYTINTRGESSIKRHTRYQHSLGVACLALQYAKATNKTQEEEILCVVSALLHDIGHAPLSHSLESVFKSHFDISHHSSGDKIIRGDFDTPIGASLNKILLNNNINPFKVMEMILGISKEPCSEIFKYNINIDTIEGIIRSSTYMYDNKHFCTTAQVSTALINVINKKISSQNVDLLDRFWLLKNDVYSNFINNRFGVYADYISQQYMLENRDRFRRSYYYGTEDQLKNDHSELFENLESIAKLKVFNPSFTKTIKCKLRNFRINRDYSLTSIKSLRKRYIKTITPFTYSYKKLEGVNSSEINQNSPVLFNNSD